MLYAKALMCCAHTGAFATRWRTHEQALTEYPEFATIQLAMIGVYWALGRPAESARMADWLRAKVPGMTISSHANARQISSDYFSETVVNALRANGFPE